MTTAVIVQARVGSTRLPGKILRPLGRHTVLEEVLHRCRAIRGADVVVCAIPDSADDDVLAPIVARANCVLVRGSGPDVLSRYAVAAQFVNADVVMRVTSDCPLIDPEVCADVLALRAIHRAEYACNNMPPSFPHGLDCEAFTTEALLLANLNAREPEEREHVTPWLRKKADVRRVNLTNDFGGVAQERWTLDYPLDYIFLTEIFALIHQSPSLPWQDVYAIVRANPKIAAINSAHHLARLG